MFLPFSPAREEPGTLHLSAEGRVCGRACLCLSRQECISARGQCGAAAGRAGALDGVFRMTRCFTCCDTPP